jgi:hypothetical protein
LGTTIKSTAHGRYGPQEAKTARKWFTSGRKRETGGKTIAYLWRSKRIFILHETLDIERYHHVFTKCVVFKAFANILSG